MMCVVTVFDGAAHTEGGGVRKRNSTGVCREEDISTQAQTERQGDGGCLPAESKYCES